MGKEAQLLEAAAAGNNSKVEQLLEGKSKLKRMLSSEKRLDDIDELERDSGLKIMMKKKAPHLEIDTRDDNGSSPLMLAALNGHRDVVHTLLTYSANVLAVDDQGSTALHFAAWHNRSDIVELLLANDAVVDAPNKAGNTPLHYACQYCPQGKTLTIVKLLQYSEASILRQNKAGDTPFSLAVRFNKKEAVALLVDAEPELLTETKSMIEAAKTGRTDIVEALLDAGMNPNCLDAASNTCPLHEAVRFFRKDTAKVLLEFGANFNQSNTEGETPITIVKQHPLAKKEEFVRLFVEFKGKTARVPKAHLEKNQASASASESSSVFITYPLLKNKKHWTKAEAEFCSAWTKQHPNTLLLDDDPTTYWKIPAAGAYSWVAFDLGSEFTLTGVRIAGWDNKQMIHTCLIETAPKLNGPWKQVYKFKADSVGHEDMSELPEPQDFKGFYETSRCWKLVVADNYGDPTTCLAEIQFFGVETEITEWFERLGLKNHLKEFIQRGYNQLSELALLSKYDVDNYIQDKEERRKLMHGVGVLREKCFPPKGLNWAVKPVSKIVANKVLPEFSVYSEPYSVGDLKLVAKGGAILGGTTVQHLVTRQNGFPSRCLFNNISLGPPGSYVLEVVSMSESEEVLRSDPITVSPPPMRQSEIGQVFDDLDKLLQF